MLGNQSILELVVGLERIVRVGSRLLQGGLFRAILRFGFYGIKEGLIVSYTPLLESWLLWYVSICPEFRTEVNLIHGHFYVVIVGWHALT